MYSSRACCDYEPNKIISDCKKYVKCKECNLICFILNDKDRMTVAPGFFNPKELKFNGISVYQLNKKLTFFDKIKLFVSQLF